MFTTTISHKDLSEAGLLVSEGFRGYKASKELIAISKRAESFARSGMDTDHDLAPLYEYADAKWNGEVLTSVIKNLRTQLTDQDQELVTKKSKGGNYQITVPNYFINEVRHYDAIRDVNAFIQKMHSKISQFKLARKKVDAETNLPLSSIYRNVTENDKNSKYEVIDAYLLKMMELITEKKQKNMLKKFDIIESSIVVFDETGRTFGESTNGKLYEIKKDCVVEA